MKKILITGATGSVGKNAIKKLLELKVPVRALVHQADACSEQLSAQGVEIVEGDLSDFDAISTALKDVTGAYYMYPIQVPGILEDTAIFAQAAIEEGVGFIVNSPKLPPGRLPRAMLHKITGSRNVCWTAQEFPSRICAQHSLRNGCCTRPGLLKNKTS